MRSLAARRAACAHLLLASAALGLAACGGGDRASSPPSAAPRGATVAVPELPTTLDPAKASTLAERAIAVATQTPLLTYRRATGEDAAKLEPALAGELPALADDEQEYRFQLRRGLVYADGRLVKASDVERAIAHASVQATDPMLRQTLRTIVGAPSRDGETLSGVRTDDRTGVVVVRLRRPDGRIPLALADPATAPLPELPRGLQPPASTGPLRIARRTGRSVELAANSLRPTISTVPAAQLAQVSIVPREPIGSAGVTNAELRAGDVDLLLGAVIPADGAPRGGVVAVRAPSNGIVSAYVLESGATEARAVRRALADAIDRRSVETFVTPMTAVCGLIPTFAVGAIERNPCPDAPEVADGEALAGVRPLRISVASGVLWAAGALQLVGEAVEELGGAPTLESVDAGDPLGALVAGKADIALVRSAPRLAHPSGWLEPAAEIDRLLAREVPRETAGPLTGSGGRWAALERRAVDRAIAIPLFQLEREAFAGPSIDQRTVRLHPVLGIDLAALDLR